MIHKFYREDLGMNHRENPGVKYFRRDGITYLDVRKSVNYKTSGVEHWHEYFEIEYYYRGNGTVIMNGKPYPLARGNISFLTPTDFHYVKTEGRVDVIRIAYVSDFLSPSYISKILSNTNKTYIVTNPDETEFILERILREYDNPSQYSEDIIRSLMTVLIADALSKSSAPDINANYSFIHSAAEYIFRHYTENISLSHVAKLFGMSESHFSRLFKKAAGQTYKEYVTNLRLGMVKNLLKNSDLPITEIALTAGYTNLSHMSKMFKSVFGISPAKYRKSQKSGGS